MSTLPAIPESFAMTNQLDSVETFQMPHIPFRTITGVIAIILVLRSKDQPKLPRVGHQDTCGQRSKQVVEVAVATARFVADLEPVR